MPKTKNALKPSKTISKTIRLPLELCSKIEQDAKKNKSDFSTILKQKLYKSYIDEDNKFDNIINKNLKKELDIFHTNFTDKFNIFEEKTTDKIDIFIEEIKHNNDSNIKRQEEFISSQERVINGTKNILDALKEFKNYLEKIGKKVGLF